MAQDRFKYFRIEAREILDGLSRGLLDLERRADAELVARLLRLAHTLKGAARIVGHGELGDLAHRMEDTLAPLRSAPIPQRLDAALALLDGMSRHVAALQQPADGTAPGPPIAHPFDRPLDGPALRADPAALDAVLSGLADVRVRVRRLRGVEDPAVRDRGIDQLERELGELHQAAERLRLVAAGTLFTALERTARDAALAAGKRVAFAADGGEVRVDAHVLATLHGALVQLVRNAVAHGIERPADRAAAGKPVEGEVAITIVLRGSRISITCRDDGRGIDLEAVRRAAVGQGFAADRARELDRDQLIGMVLRGGLTTSAEVTAFAGRGIGLDVVRETVRVLGGEVTVRTAASGTAITIVAPTSIAAMPVLVLGAGDRVAGIPLTAVRRVARITEAAILHGHDGTRVALDDLAIPFASLTRVLGDGGAGGRRMIAVVDGGDGPVAIGADRVLGVEDAVVRPVPAAAPIDRTVWGIALDTDGLPRPILEPAALALAVRAMRVAPAEPVARPQPILIVDDSLTTRMLEQSILESAGYDVETASSAEDALARIARRAYALLLVDVEMPGMDGFGLIAALRAQPQRAATPAILVTSRDRPDDRQRGAAVGAQGYIVKSEFDQTTLLGLIRRLVHG